MSAVDMHSLETTITWSEVNRHSPDMDTEVLVYDGALDDVVLGCLTADLDGGAIWRESYTDNLLTDPLWWADKPYPDAD